MAQLQSDNECLDRIVTHVVFFDPGGYRASKQKHVEILKKYPQCSAPV